MNLPARTNPYSMMDAILIMLLAYRIHGTDEAIRAAAHNVRDKVAARCRPLPAGNQPGDPMQLADQMGRKYLQG